MASREVRLARFARCRELREAGWTLEAIAGEVGYKSIASVWEALRQPPGGRARDSVPLREVCRRGHQMTRQNTLYWKCGRRCRTCRRVTDRAKALRNGPKRARRAT